MLDVINLPNRFEGQGQMEIVREWQYCFPAFGEVYFRIGRLLLTGEAELFAPILPGFTRSEQGYFFLHAAAAFNHKSARFWYGVLIGNGMIPAPFLVDQATHF